MAVSLIGATHVAYASSVDFVSMDAQDSDISAEVDDRTASTGESSSHSPVSDSPNEHHSPATAAAAATGQSSRSCSSETAQPSPVAADALTRSNNSNKSRKGKLLLWQFLLHDLLSGRSDLSWHPDQLKNPGIFSFKDPNSAAKRWGYYKGNENMSYEKMSRCIRDYYTRRDNYHFGVMQPDLLAASTTHSSSSADRSQKQRRRLHFAFNLRNPAVAAYIKQHSSSYFYRLVHMKLIG